MKNWKIGVRLGLSFAITLMLMLVLAGLSIWRMYQLHDISDVLYEAGEKSTMATELHGIAETNLTAFRVIITTDDQNEIRDQNALANERTRRLDQLMEALGKTVKNAEGKALFDDMKAKLNNYRALQTKAQEFFSQSYLDQAREIGDKEVRPSGQAFVASVKKLVGYQNELAKKAKQQANDIATMSTRLMIVIGIVAIALALVTGIFITRSIVLPLAQLVAASERMSQGDLTVHASYDARDEVGELFRSVQTMRGNLVNIIGEVRSASDTIANASSQVAAGAHDLSMRTQQQAASLDATVLSMGELTSTVRRNTDNTGHANQLAETASRVATQGGALVEQVVVTMNSINESAKKIADIIFVIDGIAFQTNLLALNASVEAARAGEQGRGFAVVAGEVRRLAQRAAEAAKDIKQLIEDSLKKVECGDKLVNEAGKTMTQIVNSIQHVSTIMSAIGTATEQQSSDIEQVNSAITLMDEVTQQNSALVEEAAAAAEAMQEQARTLVHLVSVFKLGNQPAPVPAPTSASASTPTARRKIELIG